MKTVVLFISMVVVTQAADSLPNDPAKRYVKRKFRKEMRQQKKKERLITRARKIDKKISAL